MAQTLYNVVIKDGPVTVDQNFKINLGICLGPTVKDLRELCGIRELLRERFGKHLCTLLRKTESMDTIPIGDTIKTRITMVPTSPLNITEPGPDFAQKPINVEANFRRDFNKYIKDLIFLEFAFDDYFQKFKEE